MKNKKTKNKNKKGNIKIIMDIMGRKLERRYLGKTKGNIKHGNSYFIVIHYDLHFGRKIVFVHTSANLTNCKGAIEYNEDEWTED